MCAGNGEIIFIPARITSLLRKKSERTPYWCNENRESPVCRRTTHLNSDVPQGVAISGQDPLHGDLDLAEGGLLSRLGQVAGALDPAVLAQFGDHHHGWCPAREHQLPEVLQRVRQWALGRDVGPLFVVIALRRRHRQLLSLD